MSDTPKRSPTADPNQTEAELTANGDVVLGDSVSGEIEQGARQLRRPSLKRKRQMLDFSERYAMHLRESAERRGETIGEDEVQKQVKAKLDEFEKRQFDLKPLIDELAPELETRPADEVNRDVEASAVSRLPQLMWVREVFGRYRKGPQKMEMWRRLVAAVVLHMGFASCRPTASRVLEEFEAANAVRGYMHLHPGAAPEPSREVREGKKKRDLSAFYKQLKAVCGPRHSWRIWEQMNREFLLELAGGFDEATGKFANVPDALRYLMVDAVLIEADLEQSKPATPELARTMRLGGRERCGFVVYSRNGQVIKRCHGYKWLQVSSLKLGGRALIGKLLPANCDERAETLKLLQELFELWPELTAQQEVVLIGDALYDNDMSFAYELVFKYCIHPCFPRAGTIGKEYMWHHTGGVPCCDCGSIAAFKEVANWPTPAWRRRRGLPDAGEYVRNSRGDVVDDARIRWQCPNGVAGCTAPDTYARENPRLYTYLHHGGGHQRAAKREVLLSYRNTIESTFAQLKDMGLAGKDQMRPRWAKDDQMDHLCWMAVTALSARALAHATGLYEETLDQMRELNLLEAPTPTNPAPGPRPLSELEAMQLRRSWRRRAKAPAGFPSLDDLDRRDGVVDERELQLAFDLGANAA